MIEMGIVVGACLLISLAKMPWRWKIWVLSSPMLIDVLIFAALMILHWGTFSGVMVATIGAGVCSVVLSFGRWLIGYMKSGKYVAGRMDIGHHLVTT